MWVISRITPEFIKRMLDVLEVYERPYNPKKPVVCLDEKSKQLLLETREPIETKPGQVKRSDYEYKRNGTVNFMVAHVVKTEKLAKLRATFLLFGYYSFCICPADTS